LRPPTAFRSPGASAPQNVYNLEAEYAHSVTDVPYRFVAGALYELPFGAGTRFSTGRRWTDEIIGRWQFNVLPTFQSGFPVSINQSSNPNSTIAGNGIQRPNLVPGAPLGTKGSLYARLNGYINPAAFASSAAYTFGNAPRTLSLRGPGYENWDMSLFKSVLVRDRVNVQFRASTFNTFNTPLFAGPNTAFGSANFGAITAQANFPRYLQLGLHITY
jgi:trimeric autotransporter adhesin